LEKKAMEFPINEQDIRRLDASGYLHLLRSFSGQLDEALEIMRGLRLSPDGRKVQNIVVAGMGGSAIGGDLLRTYLADIADQPIVVQREYSLPHFVGPDTLVFISSYSGNTEETLEACRQALAAGSRIIGIASGGRLAQVAAEEGFPLIRVPGGYPPRAALGYSFTCLLTSMSQLELIDDQEQNLREARDLIRQRADEYDPSVALEKNQAKQLALKLHGMFPVIYTWGQRYEAVAVRWRGQLAENGKHLSSHHVFPEMNHNEIVGWKHPEELLRKMVVILLRDRAEPQRIAKRMEITKALIAPPAAGILEVWATGKNLLARLFSLIYLGDFVSFYLAALNGVDPTPIARIEELKKRLAGAG
jgi:glucose/mannose-6-phosphate isomerase